MGGRRGQLPSPFFDALVARHAAVLDPFQSVRGVRHPFGQGWIPEVRIRQARKVFAYIEGAGLIDASMVSPPFRAGERRFISLTHRRLSPHARPQRDIRRRGQLLSLRVCGDSTQGADSEPAPERVQFQQRMRFKAILKRRCPRCLRGQVFASAFRMRRNCGVCDLRFERHEPGYFVGALYFAYGLAVLLGTPPAAYLWWQGFSIEVNALVITGELIILWGLYT